MSRLGLRAVLLAVAVACVASAETPQVNYLLQCQGCHLPDGTGKPGAVPSLVGVGRFLRVDGGREFLIRVPGSAMSPLSDADLALLLNWMVRRYGPPEVAATFRPFDEAEVARHRRPPLSDVEAVRSGLLESLGED